MRRRLQLTRGDADHDPMFRAVWINGYDAVNALFPAPEPESEPEALALILPPAPPLSEIQQRWKAVVERADEVVSRLRLDRVLFDGAIVLGVVNELIEAGQDPSADDIIAAYHKRIQQ